jgi:GT2 family glycosyltransferase/predicted SAM-dependent methyltransferase
MLSIIIPVFNQHEMTRECISAIQGNTQDYEIIMVDNGSFPPIEGATIRNETNLGFPVAVNQGIGAAQGDVICLLNNDVIVTPGWSEHLLSGLDKFDIVGPMTNYCAGIQIAGLPVYYDIASLNDRAVEFSENRKGMNLEVNWVIGFLFMFRRSLYDEIGGFDESLWPCSGEEIDFAFRAREKGHTVGIMQDVYVHHEGSVTFRSMDEDYNAIVDRNNAHLAEKWGKDFWSRQLLPLTDGKGLRLNVGCGPFKLNGFINIDKSKLVECDLRADVLDLPYEAGTVDEIYAGHILEHFNFIDGMKALYYWYSLLKEGGTISVTVPDFFYLARDYVAKPTADGLKEFNDTYVYSEGQESPHRYAYDENLLRQAMGDAGFSDLKRMPVNHPYFPYPVDWQVGIQGRK